AGEEPFQAAGGRVANSTQHSAVSTQPIPRLATHFSILGQCEVRDHLPPQYTQAMTSTLETARLLLTPLQLADAEFTQRFFPHWEIVRFLDARVPWPYPPDGAHNFYRDVAIPAIERGEAWHWTLRLKTAPQLVIGSVALMKGKDNRGFWIGLPWDRQGLMS